MIRIFRFFKNVLDIITYIMAITLGIDLIMIFNGFGRLSDLIVYILDYFV